MVGKRGRAWPLEMAAEIALIDGGLAVWFSDTIEENL